MKLISKSSESGSIQFEVRDTGIGMSDGFIESGLFEPFEQEEKPLIGAQRGVGLGDTELETSLTIR